LRLPDATERRQIWEIVIARHGRKADNFDVTGLAKTADQFTGAEIDAVFVDALYDAFLEDGREPTDLDLVNAMVRMVPIARLMDGQIAALKNWAKGRARTAVAEQSTAKKDHPQARRHELRSTENQGRKAFANHS
jgi:SpoVK/Ycf46/Vps4 family AAA+-type ATPase